MIRREFITKSGQGITFAAVAPGFLSENNWETIQEKPVRIGIIGAENSHTAGFGKLFNIDKKFPGVEVKYVWGETDEFARKAMEQGSIPNQVKDPVEMLGNIDALIVDFRHPKYHLPAAIPFVKAGIPTFIDKPFCYRATEGKEFLHLAKIAGTPVTSYSSIAQTAATFNMKEQVAALTGISQIIMTGTADLDSPYGGIFFYGVHIVEPLMYMFGEEIESVRITRNGKYGNASIKFSGGLFATLIFKSKAYGWETFVETENKLVEIKSRVVESDPPKNYVDMVDMFRTGNEPRSHQSILNSVSVLEALEKSAKTEKWIDVDYLEID